MHIFSKFLFILYDYILQINQFVNFTWHLEKISYLFS